MLKALKFVKGSIAKTDNIPELTHFLIKNGFVRGYNGTLALCSPIPLDITCAPKAEALIRAIESCDENLQLSMTSAGRLSIKSGSFKTFIDCVEGDTPHVGPEGSIIHIDGEQLLLAFDALEKFINADENRAWSNGVLLYG